MLVDVVSCLQSIVNFILFLFNELEAFFVGVVKGIAYLTDLVGLLPAFLVPIGALTLTCLIASKLSTLK